MELIYWERENKENKEVNYMACKMVISAKENFFNLTFKLLLFLNIDSQSCNTHLQASPSGGIWHNHKAIPKPGMVHLSKVACTVKLSQLLTQILPVFASTHFQHAFVYNSSSRYHVTSTALWLRGRSALWPQRISHAAPLSSHPPAPSPIAGNHCFPSL